jgi:hypothetical protein
MSETNGQFGDIYQVLTELTEHKKMLEQPRNVIEGFKIK